MSAMLPGVTYLTCGSRVVALPFGTQVCPVCRRHLGGPRRG